MENEVKLTLEAVEKAQSNRSILSASEVRTYCDCARKRYYSSRDFMALRSKRANKSLDIGKAVHRWMELSYTQGYVVDDETDADSELAEADKKVVENIKKNYRSTMESDLAKYEVLACEHPFSIDNFPIDNVLFHGYIDMIVKEKDTNKCYFFEHKTCSGFRPEIYNRFDIQLHIYDIYGKMYCEEHDYEWCGMLLNEVKKGSTKVGYDEHRTLYTYSDKERTDFINWLTRKVTGAVTNTTHEPCNNYMTCKMCEYADICLKYGYEVPSSAEEVVNEFTDDDGANQFSIDKREDNKNEQESD